MNRKLLKALKIVVSDTTEIKSITAINTNVTKSILANAAQKVYDEWDQSDEEEGDPELGFGGICQDIAEAMASVLIDMGFDAQTVSQQIDDQHVYVVLKTEEGVYSLDIPPYIYETGGGYNWKKKEGVRFLPNYIAIDRLDSDPNEFEKYLDY